MESGVEVFEIKSGKRLHRFETTTGGVPRIALSPDGKWLASGGSDNKARVWELATAKLVYELPHQYHLVFGLHFSSDSTRLISGAGDGVATHGEVKSWDMGTGKKVWRYEGKQIWMVATLPGSAAAVSIDVGGAIVFHDWGTGAATRACRRATNAGRLLSPQTEKYWRPVRATRSRCGRSRLASL